MKKGHPIGNAVVLWIIGLFPMIFLVIITALAFPEYIINIMSGLSSLMGGLLCLFVSNKEFDVRISEHNWKLNLLDLFILIVMAFFYNISIISTLKKDALIDIYGENNSISVSMFIAGVFIGPIGEELIYRYGIFSVLKGKNKNFFRIAAALLISSAMFTLLHFEFGFLRILDLIIFGFLTGIIFLATKNIIYSILFHCISNAVSYGSLIFFQKFKFNEKIIFISIPLTVIFMILFFIRVKKRQSRKKVCFLK